MTRTQAEEAAKWVLGAQEYTALVQNKTGLPRILEMAALKAFREDWPNEGCLEYIRGALQMLAQKGYFTFEDE